jgi:hypothetical protein
MDLEIKKGIYMDRFPFPLNVMMCSQLSEAHVEKQSHLTYLIEFFGSWRKSKEGSVFWSEILLLYSLERVSEQGLPTDTDTLRVINKHNIQYPENTWKTEERKMEAKGKARVANQLEIALRFK